MQASCRNSWRTRHKRSKERTKAMTPCLSEAGPGRPTCGAGLPLGASKERPWPTWPDEELLVEYARKGTRQAFEELVRRYERPLYSYLRRYLGDTGLAEDAFQATFLTVHLRRNEFDPRRPFRPWVYRIARTRAIDLFRRNRRHNRLILDARSQGHEPGAERRPLEELPDVRALSPADRLEMGEDRERLGRLVDSLPARLRGVLVQVMLRGVSYQEAADTLGIPLGTVKSRLHEALLRLRKIPVAAA
jgi:RNA polymerase sigma-70 factor (ECF subfamily)